MQSAAKVFLISVILTIIAIAQTQATNPQKVPGTISGRITAGSDPAAGVEVVLKRAGNQVTDMLQSGPAITATTDSNGWYRLTGIAPGIYRLVAYAPAYVIEGDNNPMTPGKTVNLAEGENVENVSFSITRGGVLTGKVTDPDDHPLIAEFVRAYKLNAEGKRDSSPGLPDFNFWQTDDRGIYRIYGLEPGRYIIAAGASSEDAIMKMLGGGTYYRRTFHPQTVEESQAKIIELRSGAEVESVDIKLAPTSQNKAFAASGRVVEAESGKPVAGVMIGYGVTKVGSSSFGFGNSATNSVGEFRLEGLTPNSYNAFVVELATDDNYGDPLNFEITDSDVAGLEIKMHQGSSISGVAVIEAATDPKLLEKLAKVQIYARLMEAEQQTFLSGGGGTGQITANGTFKIGGIKPGKIQLIANTFMAEKGFSLLRIEHNGVQVKELQLSAGDRLTGVRLVFAYGTASIAGRVEVRGGTLPPNVKLAVMARREGAGENAFGAGNAEVDARGQFLIEGLSAGTYRLVLSDAYYSPNTARTKLPKVEQVVSVTGSGRQEIVLVLDLSKEEK